jgi:glutamate dehydrogenase
MHLQVDRLMDAAARQQLAAGIERVLADVRAATADWPAMREKLLAAAAELGVCAAAVPAQERAENHAFLDWLANDNLVLLGYREHRLLARDGADVLELVSGTGLGVLRESGEEKATGSAAALPPQARALARAAAPMVVMTKANARATVHRPGYVDYFGIKRYDAQGNVTGEHRFLGLLTSTAYAARVGEIPLLRGKVAAVAQRAGLAPDSHLGKALTHILETYPRDELFAIGTDELHDIAMGILQLGRRQRFRLFVRRDPFDRFVSCLIYVPRENYDTELRRRFIDILSTAFNGQSAEFDVLLTDARLARVHITVRAQPGALPRVDVRELEARLAAASRRWDDDLRDALIEFEGEGPGAQLLKRWQRAFPAAYRERVSPRAASA